VRPAPAVWPEPAVGVAPDPGLGEIGEGVRTIFLSRTGSGPAMISASRSVCPMTARAPGRRTRRVSWIRCSGHSRHSNTLKLAAASTDASDSGSGAARSMRSSSSAPMCPVRALSARTSARVVVQAGEVGVWVCRGPRGEGGARTASEVEPVAPGSEAGERRDLLVQARFLDDGHGRAFDVRPGVGGSLVASRRSRSTGRAAA
jgi:hypothetical protein